MGFNLSVAVYIDFIALAGKAAKTGVMILKFIDIEISRQRRHNKTPLSIKEITSAIETATAMRFRPVTITAFSTMIALIPIMLATGSGADVTHRIEVTVLGGILTVLVLSLLVFPVLYSLMLQFQEQYRKKTTWQQ